MKEQLTKRPKKNFPRNLHFDPPTVRPESYFVIDFETHDLDPENPITEIGIVFVEKGAARRKFSSLVRLEMPQRPDVAKLTGITNDMLSSAPDLFQVARKLGGFIGRECRPIFAHNMQFDARLVYCHGLADMILPDCLFCDSIALAKLAFPKLPSYSLDKLKEELGLSERTSHRALDDALVAAELIERCYDKIEDKHSTFVFDERISPTCPNCSSTALQKSGLAKDGRQRYVCSECNTKFVYGPKKAEDRRRRISQRNPTAEESRAGSADGELHCPNCGSSDLRKQERRGNSRRYLCKNCGKKTSFWLE